MQKILAILTKQPKYATASSLFHLFKDIILLIRDFWLCLHCICTQLTQAHTLITTKDLPHNETLHILHRRTLRVCRLHGAEHLQTMRPATP